MDAFEDAFEEAAQAEIKEREIMKLRGEQSKHRGELLEKRKKKNRDALMEYVRKKLEPHHFIVINGGGGSLFASEPDKRPCHFTLWHMSVNSSYKNPNSAYPADKPVSKCLDGVLIIYGDRLVYGKIRSSAFPKIEEREDLKWNDDFENWDELNRILGKEIGKFKVDAEKGHKLKEKVKRSNLIKKRVIFFSVIACLGWLFLT